MSRTANHARTGLAVDWRRVEDALWFSELVHLLESSGFRLIKEKGFIRYYAKAGHDRLIRVESEGSRTQTRGER